MTKDFPVATAVDVMQKQYPSKTVALIGIDLAAYRRKYHSKTIRKNVNIPEWLADLASEENINFSQTLTDALKEKLRVRFRPALLRLGCFRRSWDSFSLPTSD